MKNSFFIAILLLSSLFANAQKIDLDRHNFNFRYRWLPMNPLSDDIKTYSVRVRNNSGNTASERDIAEQIRLEGFAKTQNERGDLTLELNLGSLYFEGANLRSRKDEKKDKDGKVTSTTIYYWMETYYSYEANARVYNEKRGGNSILTDNYNRRDLYKTSESTNSQAVSDDFNRKREEIRRNMLNDFTSRSINTFIQTINREFGYPIFSERLNFWKMDNPKHPENAKHIDMCMLAGRIIESFRGDDELTDRVFKDISPAIDYFKSIPQRYKSNDKNDRKLRYSAFFNLMTIYYCLDDMDNALRYADALIANDFDTSDGKAMVQKANAVRDAFSRTRINVRQFRRESRY